MLKLAQEFQHFSIQQVSSKRFIFDVNPIAIKDSEGTPEAPQSPPPANFFPETQAIPHPRQRDSMRRVPVTAPFTDVHSHPFVFEILEGLNNLPAQSIFIPDHLAAFG